jgi:uncharacterized membrane protein
MNVAKILVLLAIALLASSFASAVNLDVVYVEINGDELGMADNYTHNLEVQRGEDIEIKVRVHAMDDVSNVQVEADIVGYKYADKEEALVSDTSKTFDLTAGDLKNVELNLEIPTKMDKKYTKLRIRVADEDGTSFEQVYQFHVVGVDTSDAVIIKDFSFSPSTALAAGRAFTAMVRVENIGNEDLDDVSVAVSVPSLNIIDTEYLDQLDADEKETLEEFLLRIPDCAQPGTYTVKIEAKFNDGETTVEEAQLTVLEGNTCSLAPVSAGKTLISIPNSLDVAAGSEVAYPIMISNQGTTARTFSVTVSGVESWGRSTLSPSALMVVNGGETETVYLYIDTDADANGEKLFVVTVASDAETKEVPITANVTAGRGSASLTSGLQWAFIILVIILIIVGLIIGFTKLKGGNDDEGTQTYY